MANVDNPTYVQAKGRHLRAGFTLLELIIALGIVTIISIGLFTAFRQPTERNALNSASLTLRADLRYAQRRAIIEGRNIYVLLEPGSNRYTIGYSQQNRRYRRTVYFENGVWLRGNSREFHFLPRGTPGGNIEAIWLRVECSRYRYDQDVVVQAISGRVRLGDIGQVRR